MTGDPSSSERAPTAGALIRPFLSAGATDLGADTAGVEASTGLRPFLLTAGRVAADVSIAIETQVISTELGRASIPSLAFERRDIVAICDGPLALAEIAAQLGLHLGVIRVLVGDLSAEGHIAVYLPNTDVSQDVDTLLRVIRGLRAIS
ncbi:MAG: hypothetical protein V7637_5448 [Mycobacteriales bacterium]